MRSEAALAATVIGLLFAGGAQARADGPVPGDTRETAIGLSLGVPATAATSGARREAGDPEGGHSVWFRFDSPVQGAYAVDFGGTDFDAVSAFAQTGPLGPVVTRRGSRVRSLTAPGLPARATVTLGCRGRGCPLTTRRRTAARFGTVSLTPLLRRALLRPGVRVTVTVRARGRATRSATWRVRARRAPARVVSP